MDVDILELWKTLSQTFPFFYPFILPFLPFPSPPMTVTAPSVTVTMVMLMENSHHTEQGEGKYSWRMMRKVGGEGGGKKCTREKGVGVRVDMHVHWFGMKDSRKDVRNT